jgi:hypothetical protein
MPLEAPVTTARGRRAVISVMGKPPLVDCG